MLCEDGPSFRVCGGCFLPTVPRLQCTPCSVLRTDEVQVSVVNLGETADEADDTGVGATTVGDRAGRSGPSTWWFARRQFEHGSVTCHRPQLPYRISYRSSYSCLPWLRNESCSRALPLVSRWVRLLMSCVWLVLQGRWCSLQAE